MVVVVSVVVTVVTGQVTNSSANISERHSTDFIKDKLLSDELVSACPSDDVKQSDSDAASNTSKNIIGLFSRSDICFFI